MRAVLLAAGAAALGACVGIGFGRALSPEEYALESEVRAYYTQVQGAFAAGDAEALAALFAPELTRPMTRDGVRDWAREFFAKNGRARFRVLDLRFEELGAARAVVTLRYKVEPLSGVGGFGGTETDTLERRGGRWFTAAWEKVP